jgi:hypothetical protein
VAVVGAVAAAVAADASALSFKNFRMGSARNPAGFQTAPFVVFGIASARL